MERPSDSPAAAARLREQRAADPQGDHYDAERATDCGEGCETEPDWYCQHGWMSAAATLTGGCFT